MNQIKNFEIGKNRLWKDIEQILQWTSKHAINMEKIEEFIRVSMKIWTISKLAADLKGSIATILKNIKK